MNEPTTPAPQPAEAQDREALLHDFYLAMHLKHIGQAHQGFAFALYRDALARNGSMLDPRDEADRPALQALARYAIDTANIFHNEYERKDPSGTCPGAPPAPWAERKPAPTT